MRARSIIFASLPSAGDLIYHKRSRAVEKAASCHARHDSQGTYPTPCDARDRILNFLEKKRQQTPPVLLQLATIQLVQRPVTRVVLSAANDTIFRGISIVLLALALFLFLAALARSFPTPGPSFVRYM